MLRMAAIVNAAQGYHVCPRLVHLRHVFFEVENVHMSKGTPAMPPSDEYTGQR